MADYGRSGDDQTRDREGARHGRDLGNERDSGRGGTGGWFGGDRSGGSSRGGGRGEDWDSGRREELGWGGGASASSGGGRQQERQWEPYDRSGSGRDEPRVGRRSPEEYRHEERADGDQRDRNRDRHADPILDRERDGQDAPSWSGGRSDRDERRRDSEFGYDDRHEGLPINETSRLIASNKVEGTAVYARDGRRLGSIYNFMVDKRAGKIEYAVMSYGGFLGMGTRYYPMPWDILSYDTRLGGYRVDMMERDLERAPSFDRDSEPSFDTSYGRRVRGWYGLGS